MPLHRKNQVFCSALMLQLEVWTSRTFIGSYSSMHLKTLQPLFTELGVLQGWADWEMHVHLHETQPREVDPGLLRWLQSQAEIDREWVR